MVGRRPRSGKGRPKAGFAEKRAAGFRSKIPYTRFRDGVKADVWKRLFDAVSEEPDMEYAMADATIVKVHRHGQGAKGGLKARPSADRKAG
jgi:transposase